MNFLEKRIIEDGIIKSKDILQVNSFLNHQIDVALLSEMADVFYERFKDKGVTKILTIEASGIAIGAMVAYKFGVPLLFAKKSKSKNLDDNNYISKVASFTHNNTNDIVVDKRYLNSNDKVLIVDDFLALGNALNGLIDLVKQANASVSGIGIAIEKGYQKGGDKLRDLGYDVLSLAIIEEMNPNTKVIKFRDEEK